MLRLIHLTHFVLQMPILLTVQLHLKRADDVRALTPGKPPHFATKTSTITHNTSSHATPKYGVIYASFEEMINRTEIMSCSSLFRGVENVAQSFIRQVEKMPRFRHFIVISVVVFVVLSSFPLVLWIA